MTALRVDMSVGDPQGVASGDVDGVSVRFESRRLRKVSLP